MVRPRSPCYLFECPGLAEKVGTGVYLAVDRAKRVNHAVKKREEHKHPERPAERVLADIGGESHHLLLDELLGRCNLLHDRLKKGWIACRRAFMGIFVGLFRRNEWICRSISRTQDQRQRECCGGQNQQ